MPHSSISLKENSANLWLATAAGTAGSQKLPHHKGQTQRKLCRFMAMFTHQQLSLTLRVQFQQPKPRWKLTATERNSSATASPPLKNQPLPLRCHLWPCPTSTLSQLRSLSWQSESGGHPFSSKPGVCEPTFLCWPWVNCLWMLCNTASQFEELFQFFFPH